MKNNKNSTKTTIEAVEAFLASKLSGDDDGIKSLEDRTDDISIGYRLDLLSDAGRFQDACAVVKPIPPSPNWIAKAAHVAIRAGDTKEAERLLTWAKAKARDDIWKQTVVAVAKAHLVNLNARMRDMERVAPGEVQGASELTEARSVLAPVISSLVSRGSAPTSLDQNAAKLYLEATILARDTDDLNRIKPVIESIVPIPIMLVRAAFDKLLPPGNNWPDRLREEHSSFDSNVLAAALDGLLIGKTAHAFQSVKSFCLEELTDDQKEQVIGLRWNLAQRLGLAQMEETLDVAKAALGDAHSLVRLLSADCLLHSQKTTEAGAILDELDLHENLVWLQLNTNRMLQEEETEKAVKLLKAANSLAPGNTQLLRQLAGVALQHDLYDDALFALSELLALKPDDRETKQNLAMLYVRQEKYSDAERHFEELKRRFPEDALHSVNLALSLIHNGKTDAALLELRQATEQADAPIQTYLVHAELLAKLGRPEEAFRLLAGQRSRWWDEPDYLNTIRSVAYACGENDVGAEAISHLKELQDRGEVAPRYLEEVSLDELKQHFSDRRVAAESALSDLLRGRIPWLAADRAQGHEGFWAWANRTQEVKWLSNEMHQRAKYTVYATNGFRVVEHGEVKRLENVDGPGPDAEVVADLTALFTLFRLGILDEAAGFFSRIAVPTSYLPYGLQAGEHLLPHQVSKKKSAEHLLANFGVEAVCPRTDDHDSVLVDEYAPDDLADERRYVLSDLVPALRDGGFLELDTMRALQAVAHRPPSTVAETKPLTRGSTVWIALSSLETLYQIGALEAVQRCMRIRITPEHHRELRERLAYFKHMEEVRQWHEALWQAMAEHPRFDRRSLKQVPQHQGGIESIEVFFAAPLLAEQERLPLLADDRFCQNVAHHSGSLPAPQGFGTDALLASMHKHGRVSTQQYSDYFHKLVRWRYRFLVPPALLLYQMALNNLDSLPGARLRNVATYGHDSMSDPALFGGFEPTTPPVAMGQRLYMAWCNEIAEFLALVAVEAQFQDEALHRIVEWAITELLPQLPNTLPGRFKNALANLTPQILIGRILIWAAPREDAGRVNDVLQQMAQLLGIDEFQYSKLISGAIDGTRP